MNYEERPVAFIAMKFSGDHWRDKRYQIIREELESAGFQVIRGDEVSTSAPVVDEVCRLLRESKFVVIDSTGDSHNVSYELGYCHGISRDPGHTLLLRDSTELPFNYRHFRHRVYKDLKHLRRLIRDFLKLTEPVHDDMYGYAFTFEFSESARFGYIMDGAECILDAILETNLDGRVEVYAGEQFVMGGRYFTVCATIRLRGPRNTSPEYEYWQTVISSVKKNARRFEGRITPASDLFEFVSKFGMKKQFQYCGSAEMRSGAITRIVDPSEDTTFIQSYLQRKREMNCQVVG